MIAGPALVDWASLGDVSKEELGASRIHTRNGAIDDEASSEEEAFEMARRFLSYLPTSADELPPVTQDVAMGENEAKDASSSHGPGD